MTRARAEALLRDFEGLFCEGGDYILRAKAESGPTALGADAGAGANTVWR